MRRSAAVAETADPFGAAVVTLAVTACLVWYVRVLEQGREPERSRRTHRDGAYFGRAHSGGARSGGAHFGSAHFGDAATERSWATAAIVVTLAAAAGMVFDALTPVLIEVTLFYMGVVLAGYWFPHPKASLALMLLAAPLVIIGRWITIPEAVPVWEIWVNRGLAIATLSLTACFVWYIRVLEGRVENHTRTLRRTNEEFMAMYDRGGVLMSRLDRAGVVIDANRASVEDIGLARTDVIGRRFWEIDCWRVSPEVVAWIRDRVERALAGEASRGETSYVTGNGKERVSDIALTPIRSDSGRVELVVVGGLDVTERARQYLATFENAAVGIAQFGRDLKWTRVNRAFCRLVGCTENEIINRPVMDFIHPDHRDVALAEISDVRDGRSNSFDVESPYLRKDGATVWARVCVSAVRDDDGGVDRLVGVYQDVGARRKAEQLLQRQAALLDQSHDAIMTWRIGGRDRGIMYWSRGAEALYGYSAAEAIGATSHELLRTRAAMPIEEIEAELLRNGSWFGELVHTTREGREIVDESRLVHVRYDGQDYALETNRDVTERKRAEDQVRLLLREMNHRSKNMLSLVQVVARQTSTSDPENFLERFSDRIQALATSQDLLARTNWEGVETDDLVRGQLAHFSDVLGSRIRCNGPKLRLNGAAAQAIGMALHELATNAGKYGALSTDAGHVDIDWDAHGDRMLLQVSSALETSPAPTA